MPSSPMISRDFTEGLANFANIENYSDLRCFALHKSLPANEQPSILGCTIPVYASSPGGAKLRTFKNTYKPYIWGIPTWSKEELWRGCGYFLFCLRSWIDINIKNALARILKEEFKVPKRRHPFNPRHDRYDADKDGTGVNALADNKANNNDAPVVKEEELDKPSPTFELSNDSNQGISPESLTLMYQYLEYAIKTMGWTAREVFEFFINPNQARGQMQPADVLEYLSKMTNMDWFTGYASGPQNSTGDRVSFPHTVFYQHLRPVPADSLDNAEWIVAFKSPVAEDVFTGLLTGKPWSALHGLLDSMSQSNSPLAAALCSSVFDWMAAKQLSYHPPLMILNEMVRPARKHSNMQALQTTYSRVPQSSDNGLPHGVVGKEPPNPTKVKLQLVLTNGIRRMEDNTVPNIVSNRFYNGNRYTPLFDSFILHEEHGTAILYFFQYSVSKFKDGFSGHGYQLVVQIYKKVREFLMGLEDETDKLPGPPVKRRRSSHSGDLDVRFVLVQYHNEPRVNWILPVFDSEKHTSENRFPFKVFNATLHLETRDPSME
ncbi:hypothetical protein D9757_014110 [Collybiopsis confluens]|uniref:Uncharacterized protein n=1 Tax=Collybiopsis confluens TaxID=2823264 RepID=A0A8H5CNB7_9AGAR|nr:hypothetical protein D9757_014110 [Collybiopsis confluens]